MPSPNDITLVLPLEAVIHTIRLLGTHPHDQVADLIMAIKQQTSRQQQMQDAPPARPNGGEAHRPVA